MFSNIKVYKNISDLCVTSQLRLDISRGDVENATVANSWKRKKNDKVKVNHDDDDDDDLTQADSLHGE